MRPRLSVVVTCHDYGHFLEACLNSVAAQSRAAHEVILVDDGSTDASRSIAGGRPPGLIRVEQPNQGQAAAFNAGFARASGEAVLFLDADDVLAPDALEMLGHAWDPGLAAIAYRLDLIDAAGRVAGIYPVAPAGGDLRPALLARGHFRFMPTSGNLFTRARITPAFPLPAARWRISADALLLRAAAMAGPIRVLPLTLGAYRAHGGNAYYRATQSEMAFLRRSLRDMADACRDVADMPAAIPGPDPDAARLDLVLAFLRLRLAAAEQGETAPAAAPALREVLPRLFQLRLGLRVHAALAFILGFLPALTAVSPRSRRWIVEPDSRPWLVAQAVERLLGSDLAARRRSLQAPRWTGGAGGPVFAPSDWRPATQTGGQVLLRGCGENPGAG